MFAGPLRNSRTQRTLIKQALLYSSLSTTCSSYHMQLSMVITLFLEQVLYLNSFQAVVEGEELFLNLLGFACFLTQNNLYAKVAPTHSSQKYGNITNVSNCVLLQEGQILIELIQINLAMKIKQSEFLNSGAIRQGEKEMLQFVHRDILYQIVKSVSLREKRS